MSGFWAWVAGWGFVVGKLASCSAVALTFGYYLSPDCARYLAAGAVIAFVALNYFGIEKTAGATKIIVAVVLLADLRAAIGFSSFTVLLYYAVTNISAYTLTGQERLYSRNLAVPGLLGCLALAFTLPAASVGIGSAVMLAGIPVYLLQRRRFP